MIETAENLRRDYKISRQRQDAFALRSHQRAVTAQRDGVFADELVPVRIATSRGEQVVECDEHPRPDTTLEALAALRPVMSANRTRRPRSRPATPAAKTTAPPSVSSPIPRWPPISGCDHWPGSGRGASPASSRTGWVSGR